MYKRLTFVSAMMVMGYALLAAVLAVHMSNMEYTQTAVQQRSCTVTAAQAQGYIYDRNFRPLVNCKNAYYAVVPQIPEAVNEVLSHTLDMNAMIEGIRSKKPFSCRVDTDSFACGEIIVFEAPVRRPTQPLAQHVIGYTSDGVGVAGLEADFDSIFRSEEDIASVTYTVDALGNVLYGDAPVISPLRYSNGNLVTTLDADIQRICEEACAEVNKGAVVVMNVENGDILAMASFPTYSPDRLSEALKNENSPLINRCLYTYSVGSIFKLVTSAASYAQGMTGALVECSGKTTIEGQIFHCHDRSGHGLVDIHQAMICSCNSYFVELSRLLKPETMRTAAQDLGFGTQIALTRSIVSAGGTLPSSQQLELPAEMANFCFGQGFLTASPLQVCQMTCAIANDGEMPLARLVAGYTLDGKRLENAKPPMYAKSLPRNAAYFLQGLMIAAINENPQSNAIPEHVFAAAKTSTAQTGRYDEDGNEYCHAWITGYFPIEEPKYAVTVLVEDGGYGNDAAAPIFREIADRIAVELS
ncbi:MAG: hypothetical protein IKC40_09375 [Oscillospiraceae bacterium]|nr:hypothetical protein [Oscillospiraceae bacterium]MBR6618649.1 hypothetical protein [Oscillospiraceae bacterium]